MSFTPKVNQCALFVNERAPEKSDFNAQVDIQCPECHAVSSWWVNGWKKVNQARTKYISLALKPKGAANEQAHNGAADD